MPGQPEEEKDEVGYKMNRKTKKRKWKVGGKKEKKYLSRSTFSTGLKDWIGDQEKKLNLEVERTVFI